MLRTPAVRASADMPGGHSLRTGLCEASVSPTPRCDREGAVHSAVARWGVCCGHTVGRSPSVCTPCEVCARTSAPLSPVRGPSTRRSGDQPSPGSAGHHLGLCAPGRRGWWRPLSDHWQSDDLSSDIPVPAQSQFSPNSNKIHISRAEAAFPCAPMPAVTRSQRKPGGGGVPHGG